MRDLDTITDVPELEHTKRGHYECPECAHQGTAPVLCPRCTERLTETPNAR